MNNIHKIKFGDKDNSIAKISGNVVDYLQNEYKSGLVFKQVSQWSNDIENDKDDKLLKKLIVSKTMPMHFDLDVSGVNMLKIKTNHQVAQSGNTHTALVNLALYK